MKKIKYALLSIVLLAGCEEAIVEGITDNSQVDEVTKPSTSPDTGEVFKGSLSGKAYRMTSQNDWPDTMLIIAFGSNGRYALELVNINPNAGWANGLNALQMSGTWSLDNGYLSLSANTNSGKVTGLVRQLGSTLCYDVPIDDEASVSHCRIILVRVKK